MRSSICFAPKGYLKNNFKSQIKLYNHYSLLIKKVIKKHVVAEQVLKKKVRI